MTGGAGPGPAAGPSPAGDPDAGAVVCAWCGAPAELADPAVVLGWVLSVEGGAVRRYCPACTRTHLRAVEARLDAPDW